MLSRSGDRTGLGVLLLNLLRQVQKNIDSHSDSRLLSPRGLAVRAFCFTRRIDDA